MKDEAPLPIYGQEQNKQEIRRVEVKGRSYEHPNFPGSKMIRAEDGYTYAIRKRQDGAWEGNQVVFNNERTEVLSTQQLQPSFFEDPRNELILQVAESGY
jgi:hypothetical protein